MKTPEEIKEAHAALEQCYALITEWRKASKITTIFLYFDGYTSKGADPKLTEILKRQAITFQREAIFAQLHELEKLGVDTSTLISRDFDDANA